MRLAKCQLCLAPILKEEELHEAILTAFKSVYVSRHAYMNRIHKLTAISLPQLEEERSAIVASIEKILLAIDQDVGSNDTII